MVRRKGKPKKSKYTRAAEANRDSLRRLRAEAKQREAAELMNAIANRASTTQSHIYALKRVLLDKRLKPSFKFTTVGARNRIRY